MFCTPVGEKVPIPHITRTHTQLPWTNWNLQNPTLQLAKRIQHLSFWPIFVCSETLVLRPCIGQHFVILTELDDRSHHSRKVHSTARSRSGCLHSDLGYRLLQCSPPSSPAGHHNVRLFVGRLQPIHRGYPSCQEVVKLKRPVSHKSTTWNSPASTVSFLTVYKCLAGSLHSNQHCFSLTFTLLITLGRSGAIFGIAHPEADW